MRVLICGASGMIGHTLWRVLPSMGMDVHATLHAGCDGFAKHGLFDGRVLDHFEAVDFDGITRALDRLQPSVIINCIGVTKRKAEAGDLARTFTINTRFPHHLAWWAARHGARVIHFSTDCVFDGADGNYSERSVVTASDLYGQTKYFGELDYDHCLTIRTSMIGREIAGFSELLEWFLAQRGKSIKGFRNARYSGLTTLAMAAVVERLIREHPNLNGRCHIAGPVITKHDLLCQIRQAFGFDVEIVADDGFHCDRTLQSHRFTQATGMVIPSWQAMLAALAADREFYEHDRRPEEPLTHHEFNGADPPIPFIR